MPAPRFLKYQADWLQDTSRVKIAEKSRRIGFTWTQSFEDVNDCIAQPKLKVWFSSADESAAKEYIDYCVDWAKLHQRAAKLLGEQLIDEKHGIKAYVLEFKNGARIHALSSNPKAFRSKGGKVILDEYAWHDDPDGMWAAARPCITWGYPLRILSTHNGTNTKFYRFVEAIKAGKLKWSLHTVTIQQAVEKGLADKIEKRKLTQAEREEWLQNEHDSCGDEDIWKQEYCCEATDTALAFLTYEEIIACEDPNVLMPGLENILGYLTAGYDVARVKDLAAKIALETYGGMHWLRDIETMANTRFAVQKERLWKLLAHPKLLRGCIDSTGIGRQMAEEAQEEFGKYRIEPIHFTSEIKEELAYGVKRVFEDKAIRIPPDPKLREALHSIRKTTTTAGHHRFDAAHGSNGHADEFWALALALHAVSRNNGPVCGASSSGAHVSRIAKGYDAAPKSRLARDLRPRKIWDGY